MTFNTFTMTGEQLKRIMPNALSSNIDKYLPYLNEFMPEFSINSQLRCAHFLAQIAHESGELRYNTEIASGKAYDTGRLAVALGNTPAADGDGQKYKGRGLIQLTGTANYKRFGSYVRETRKENVDFLSNPEKVAEPRYAVMVSCWFFQISGCLVFADKDDVNAVTKRVNGGTNGLESRKKYLSRAKKEVLI